jgi:hypothetical protein
MNTFTFTDTSGNEVTLNLAHVCSVFTEDAGNFSGQKWKEYVVEYIGNAGYHTARRKMSAETCTALLDKLRGAAE